MKFQPVTPENNPQKSPDTNRARSTGPWILEDGASSGGDCRHGPCRNPQPEGGGRGKEAKEIHKQQEKELRDKLNMAYDNLRVKLLEATAAKRVSKQTVLKLAMETSQIIQAEEANLKTQMTTLTKTHLLLQEKLANLQAAQRPQQEDTQRE